ncbi:MAG: hypothetical protein WDN31_02310 [Hyphomicrobium sp.]
MTIDLDTVLVRTTDTLATEVDGEVVLISITDGRYFVSTRSAARSGGGSTPPKRVDCAVRRAQGTFRRRSRGDRARDAGVPRHALRKQARPPGLIMGEPIELRAEIAEDEPFLRRLFFATRAGEFAPLGMPPAQLEMILGIQFNAQRGHYRAGLSGVRVADRRARRRADRADPRRSAGWGMAAGRHRAAARMVGAGDRRRAARPAGRRGGCGGQAAAADGAARKSGAAALSAQGLRRDRARRARRGDGARAGQPNTAS